MRLLLPTTSLLLFLGLSTQNGVQGMASRVRELCSSPSFAFNSNSANGGKDNTPKRFIVTLTAQNARARSRGTLNMLVKPLVKEGAVVLDKYQIGNFVGYTVSTPSARACNAHFAALLDSPLIGESYDIEELEEDVQMEFLAPFPPSSSSPNEQQPRPRPRFPNFPFPFPFPQPGRNGRTDPIPTEIPWHLDRIDQRSLPLDGAFKYDEKNGDGVDLYIVDSGIRVTHRDFGGRAKWGVVTARGEMREIDVVGHGTHVAGIAASNIYGVARQAEITAVKVGGARGPSASDILAGLQWVADKHKNSTRKSVVNMSIGGPIQQALDTAVQSLTEIGVHVVVAAGNSAADACKSSPPRASKDSAVISVGASANGDKIASFSNDGPCVTVFAPGARIKSLSKKGDTAYEVMDGTSMASPLVAGIVASLLTHKNYTPAQMKQYLVATASKDMLDINRPSAKTTTRAVVYLNPAVASEMDVDVNVNVE